MEFVLNILVAFGASLLTFFSGFGLGTLLLPVFLLFFPPEVAVGLTAIVHLMNNIFKALLLRTNINLAIALRFGIPAIAGAHVGARLLSYFSSDKILASFSLFDHTFNITALNLVIGLLMIVFALFELLPVLKKFEFRKQFLIPGGLLSGFFGGLSGHQGALRSAFLIKFNLSKEVFIATGVAVSLGVDIARLSVYLDSFLWDNIQNNSLILVVTILAAFAGAVVGKRLLHKVTISFLQCLIGILIIILGTMLILGIIKG